MSGPRLALLVGQHLQDHDVGVELREILPDLALPEGVVERVIDHLRLDAETRRRVAIDSDESCGALPC